MARGRGHLDDRRYHLRNVLDYVIPRAMLANPAAETAAGFVAVPFQHGIWTALQSSRAKKPEMFIQPVRQDRRMDCVVLLRCRDDVSVRTDTRR